MKYLFTLGHPAHYHLYKHVIEDLKSKGHTIKIVISEKDILKKNLDNANIDYLVIALADKQSGLFFKAKKVLVSSFELFSICRKYKPDLMIGCLTQMGIVGSILGIPTIFNAEDDISYTMLQGIVTYPFINHILTPSTTSVGVFSYKRIKYQGFHKLAYLHPNRIKIDNSIVQKHFGASKYVMLRLVNLNAYHDVLSKGISESILDRILALLTDYSIFISSEKLLSPKYDIYKLSINENEIHHFMANASLFIGDSQSMTVEAAILGVPNIKFNSFFGKIGVLNELENKYSLTVGLSPKNEEKLYDQINCMLNDIDLVKTYEIRKQKMLEDKIDVSAFFIWFIENYPKSASILKENPDYQYNFR